MKGCFLFAFASCVLCGTGFAADNPDTILINGDVITLTGPDNGDLAEAVAISGERISAVGTSEDIGRLAGPQTEVIDLGGSAVLPGFIDAHGHFPGSGLFARHFVDLNSPPIGTVRTIDDIVARLASRAAETPKGEWIQGRGYDDTLVAEMRHPTRWDLDRASTDHPIFIGHISGHLGVGNSLAMEMAGVTRDTPQPLGGKIRMDDVSGEPNGVLEEPPAMSRVSRLLPQFSEDDLVDAVVLDRNPLEVPPLDLDGITVLRTIIGGRTVFER